MKKVKKIIYLAIPYSFNPDLSVKIVGEVASKLMEEGHVVYSPITLGHHLTPFVGEKFRKDNKYWLSQTLPIMKICTDLIFVEIGRNGKELIEKSDGCQAEKHEAFNLELNISNYKYKTQKVI